MAFRNRPILQNLFGQATCPLWNQQQSIYVLNQNLSFARYSTRFFVEYGDRDGQCNLAWFYEDAIGVERDIEQAKHWYRLAALQGHDLAIEKCKEIGVTL